MGCFFFCTEYFALLDYVYVFALLPLLKEVVTNLDLYLLKVGNPVTNGVWSNPLPDGLADE
jgi:hypothetical protein